MTTKTKKMKTFELDELIDKLDPKKEKDDDLIVPSYVSRRFLEPMRCGDGRQDRYMSTDYVYCSVGEVRNKKYSYADGSIEFGGGGNQATTLYFAAHEPDEIETTLDKVDNLEREVMDFCAKMREALEAYKVVAKVHKEGK